MGQTIIRPLRATDTGAVVGLHDRVNDADPGIGPVPAETWREFVARPGNQNGRDFRVAERGAMLVGLASVSHKQQDDRMVRLVRIIVDPAVRRRGIGSDLLASVLPPDAQAKTVWLQSLVRSDWDAGQRFATHFGFQAIEAEITMRAAQLVPPTRPPHAVTFERVDDPSLHANVICDIHNAAFRSDVSFSRAEPREILERLRGGLKLVIATAGKRVIGYACLEVEPDMTWLDGIAIDPQFQQRGVGRALAFHSLNLFAGPAGACALNVSSANEAAIRIYHELGFAEMRRTHRLAVRAVDARAVLHRQASRPMGRP
jgi:mycothiol synthase